MFSWLQSSNDQNAKNAAKITGEEVHQGHPVEPGTNPVLPLPFSVLTASGHDRGEAISRKHISSTGKEQVTTRENMTRDQQVAAPDSTAVRVALWRAMHVQVDPPPHVLEDEVGLKLAAPDEGW